MIYDYSTNCKNYSKDSYNKDFFSSTACPKCDAIGRFCMHGTYCRYIVFLAGLSLVSSSIEIRRIRCNSCGSTHAILPRDIIAYRLLSLSVILLVLFKHFLKSVPVLKIAAEFNFSHQFIYSILDTFERFRQYIFLFFKQYNPASTADHSTKCLLEKINMFKPTFLFQYNYMTYNRRPCFMVKFFGGLSPPYIAIIPTKLPSGGQQHNP